MTQVDRDPTNQLQVEFFPDTDALRKRFEELIVQAQDIEIAVAWAGKPEEGAQTGCRLFALQYQSGFSQEMAGASRIQGGSRHDRGLSPEALPIPGRWRSSPLYREFQFNWRRL